MSGGRRAKKREFSKIIISTVGAVTIFVTAFTLVMVWRTGDTSPLAYLIPAVFTETAAATGSITARRKQKTGSNFGRSTVPKFTMTRKNCNERKERT